MQILLVYFLGLIGLNIIVFVHELGHFLLARAVGINVEVFSIGMGPKLWKKQFKTFEFAISALPLGGYCKMQGETMVASSSEKPKVGDMYYGHPWRRLVAVIAGAGFNFIFAYIIFVVVSMMSTNQVRLDNRIIVPLEQTALLEPIQSGDTILAINGQNTPYFADIQQVIMTSADKNLEFTVQRDEKVFNVTKYIAVNRQSGVGILPLEPYISTKINNILPDSPAQKAGINPGESIIAVNDTPVEYFEQLRRVLAQQEPNSVVLITTINEDNLIETREVTLEEGKLGIVQELRSETVPGLPFLSALNKGAQIFTKTLSNYINGLTLLITNKINMKDSVSGPIQTTELIGNIARSSFEYGLHDILFLLGILSLIIGFMNLLPIPLLDGGLIVLFMIEMLRGGKAFSQRFLRVYQVLGMIFIIMLLSLAVSSDISFLFKKL